MLTRLLKTLLWFCCILFTLSVKGQTNYFWSYQGVPLKSVLDELHENYALSFAYSSRFIPLETPVAAEADTPSLEEALDGIFDPLPITYRQVGQQIILRPQKVEVEQITVSTPPKRVVPEQPVYQKKDERMEALMAARREKWRERLPYLQKRYISSIEGNRPLDQIDLEKYQLKPGDRFYDPVYNFFHDRNDEQIRMMNDLDAQSRLGQVSLVPFLGTNAFSSYNITNEFSVNLLWGMNGGVQGKEFGGVANTIKRDVQGVQIAGLVNIVGDDVYGTQISGLANFAVDTVQGMQIAGLFNVSGYGTAIQLASLCNIARGDFEGVQGSLLFNSIGGEQANAIQMATVMNRAKGATKFQSSLLLNRAGDIKTGQIALLLNKAERMEGFQLGLINRADTAVGIPIGLINIVKKGYNRVEFYGSEFLQGNFALKVGVRRFYNIFTIGARMDELASGPDRFVKEMSWGLGYGLGTSFPLKRRLALNTEVLSWHINERANWTPELHQLNQLKLLLNLEFGGRASLVIGPVANWMVSEYYQEGAPQPGSGLAPKTIFERVQNGRSHQVWIGWNAGLRF
jgi:hypothetical protein